MISPTERVVKDVSITKSKAAGLALGLVLAAGLSGGLAWRANHSFQPDEKPTRESVATDNTQERNLIEEYRKADFGDQKNFPVLDDAYRNRIALEFELIRSGRIEPLRNALRDPNRYVRAFAINALGILGDHESEETIAKMLADPDIDSMVGGAAVQALGWLKRGLEAVQSARATSRTVYPHLLDIAERQIKDPIDHAAKVREAYQLGLRRDELGSAEVGKPAPDFTAIDTDNKPFRLADVLKRNRVVVLAFVSADW
jgi:HEAT repeat protein